MEQAAEESIYQLSAETEQGSSKFILDVSSSNVHQVLSWQHMVATFNPQVQLEDNIEAHTEQLSSDPPVQEHVGLNMGPLVPDSEAQGLVDLNMDPLLPDSEAQDGPSVTDHSSLSLQLKVGLQIGLSSHSNNQISRIFDLTLGQNRSNTIYRLRFLAFFNLVFYVIAGILYFLGDHHRVDATNLVMFIITVGAPIVVAVISLLASYWPALDSGSEERSNWITGLLVSNVFMFGGRLAFNWVPTQGTIN